MKSFRLSADEPKARERAPSTGHNSAVSADQLKDIVERIEAYEANKAEVSSDIKDVYTEARGNGFSPKIIRKLIAIRKKDQHEREEEQALLEVYMGALGMLSGTPLGDYAEAQAKEEAAE